MNKAILGNGHDLNTLIYKAGHHGAKTSSSKAFFEVVWPQCAVISAGEENCFGHPNEEVLQRISDVGAAVLRTNELGSIEVITDGKRIWWETVTRRKLSF